MSLLQLVRGADWVISAALREAAGGAPVPDIENYEIAAYVVGLGAVDVETPLIALTQVNGGVEINAADDIRFTVARDETATLKVGRHARFVVRLRHVPTDRVINLNHVNLNVTPHGPGPGGPESAAQIALSLGGDPSIDMRLGSLVSGIAGQTLFDDAAAQLGAGNVQAALDALIAELGMIPAFDFDNELNAPWL